MKQNQAAPRQHEHEPKSLLSHLAVPLLTAVLGLGGCGKEEDLTVAPPPADRPQSLVQATFHRSSSFGSTDSITGLTFTFPKGDYRVALMGLKLNKVDGEDSIKNATQIWAADFHSPKDGTVFPVDNITFDPRRSVFIVSGRNELEQNVQQWIVPNSDSPSVITHP